LRMPLAMPPALHSKRPSNQRKHLARMWHMTGIAASEY
jgi:hypothetical protein